jgi:vacuolar protein sorting-associated protein 13A/C
VDYINYKVLALLDASYRANCTVEWAPITNLGYLLSYTDLKLLTSTQAALSFTDIQIHIKRPHIVLTPRPHYPEYFVLNLGDIHITNHHDLTAERHPDTAVWLDIFKIEMEQMGIFHINSPLSQPFNLHLTIERPILSPEQYDDIAIDKRYSIKAVSDTLLLSLSQSQFSLIFKLLDLNLTYDDHLERLVNPEQKPPIIYDNSDPTHGGMFIDFSLNCDFVSLLLTHEIQDIAEFVLTKLRLQMDQFNDYFNKVSLTAHQLLIKTAEVARSEASPQTQSAKDFQESDKSRLHQDLLGPLKGELTTPMLRMSMDKTASGTMAIYLVVQQTRVNFNLALFFALQNFFYYGLPNYEVLEHTPFDYMHKYRPRKHHSFRVTEDRYMAPRITVDVRLDESIIVLPVEGPQVLVTQSNVNFFYQRESEANRIEDLPLSVKQLVMENLEAFTCRTVDLVSKASFASTKKRRLLEPVKFIYLVKDFSALTGKKACYREETEVGMLELTVSHKDFVLFYLIAAYQSAKLKACEALIHGLGFVPKSDSEVTDEEYDEPDGRSSRMSLPVAATGRLSVSSALNRRKQKRKSEIVNDAQGDIRRFSSPGQVVEVHESSTVDFSINGREVRLMGCELVLINDTSGCYSPLLKVYLNTSTVTVTLYSTDKCLRTQFTLKVNFYNPLADSWEPFLEKGAFLVELLNSEVSEPRTQLLLGISPGTSIDLVLSEMLVKHLTKTFTAWQLTWHIEGSLELASPFEIENQSGHSISVYNDTDSSGAFMTVEPGCRVQYQIDTRLIRNLDLSRESFTIVLNREPAISPISRIRISRVGSVSRIVSDKLHKYLAIVDLRIDDTRRVLRVTSSMLFVNHSEFDIHVMLSGTQNQVVSCEAGKRLPLPVDYASSEVSILPVNADAYEWVLVNLAEFHDKQTGFTKTIENGEFFLLAELELDKLNPDLRILHIKPPVVVRNGLICDMILTLFSEVSRRGKEIKIKKGERYSDYASSFKSEVNFSVQLAGFSPSNRFRFISRREKPPKTVTMYDASGEPLTILMEQKSSGSLVCTFYSPIVIVNETGLQLSFYYKKTGSVSRVAGHYTDLVPCYHTKKLCLALGALKSEPFKVSTMGTKKVISIKGELDTDGSYVNYQFVYDVQLGWPLADDLLYSYVVTVSPRFVLVNKLSQTLIVMQKDTTSMPLILGPNNRSPYHWPDGRQTDQVKIRVAEGGGSSMVYSKGEGSIWDWSGYLNISSIGITTIQMRNLMEPCYFKLIKVSIRVHGVTAFATFEEENERYCSYRIENLSTNVSMCLYQDGCKDEKRWLDCLTSVPFAWTHPLEAHKLVVEFYVGRLTENPVKLSKSYYFLMDKMNQYYKIKLSLTPEKGYVIYGKTLNSSSTRVLCFTDTPQRFEDQEEEVVLTQVTISLPTVSVSYVEHATDRVAELLYLTASNIEILGAITNKQQMFELILDSLQIDNQHNLQAVYPVLLHSPPGLNRTLLHLSVVRNLDGNPDCYNFESLEVLMQTLKLNIELSLLQRLSNSVNRLLHSLAYKKNHATEIFIGKDKKIPWLEVNMDSLVKNFYISSLKFFPVVLLVSFSPLTDQNSDSDAFTTVFKALGAAFVSIDSAPLRLSSIEISDVYGPHEQVFSALALHYKSQFQNEFFSLISHAEILGNPVGLFNNLGTGFADLFYEPAQGIINGPISSGKGLVKGAGPVGKIPIEGSFRSVSKAVGGFNEGGIALTHESDYIVSSQHEKARNKPRDVVEGFGLGMKSLLVNIGKGLTGVVTQPAEGARKSGFKGFFYGGIKGLSGLVVKPVVGMFNVASKTAEGIKSGVSVDRVQMERVRSPRAVYGRPPRIATYVQTDSDVRLYMSRFKKGKYNGFTFEMQIYRKEGKKSEILLVLYTDLVVLVDLYRHKVVWEVPVKALHTVEVGKGAVKMCTSPSANKRTRGKTTFEVPLASQTDRVKIYVAIENLRAIS